ncbi:glutathione S-transferase N-terminal domain-containing protein [Lyngbya sp. CCAP 1446/10]|nr:glutathione S-transferase N-terminal domain-containing protein [Lyngbya sp. CCAP 1446/10]
MLKLYYTPMSLNSRRVWVALLEKQIAFEPHSTSTATSKFLQPAWHGFHLYRRNRDRPQSGSPANRPHSIALPIPLSIPAERYL